MALGRESVEDLYPEDVAKGLAEGTVLLVDVREPNETDVERYPDAIYMPMSEFDPSALPDPQGKRVVFARRAPQGRRFSSSCRAGNRSVTASLVAQNAGLPSTAQLSGCIKAWQESG